jgi:hypothetical protein
VTFQLALVGSRSVAPVPPVEQILHIDSQLNVPATADVDRPSHTYVEEASSAADTATERNCRF